MGPADGVCAAREGRERVRAGVGSQPRLRSYLFLERRGAASGALSPFPPCPGHPGTCVCSGPAPATQDSSPDLNTNSPSSGPLDLGRPCCGSSIYVLLLGSGHPPCEPGSHPCSITGLWLLPRSPAQSLRLPCGTWCHVTDGLKPWRSASNNSGCPALPTSWRHRPQSPPPQIPPPQSPAPQIPPPQSPPAQCPICCCPPSPLDLGSRGGLRGPR